MGFIASFLSFLLLYYYAWTDTLWRFLGLGLGDVGKEDLLIGDIWLNAVMNLG